MISPLWHKEPEELWRSIIHHGFKVMIIAVACEGLDQSWLGKVIDKGSLDQLLIKSRKHRFHPCGEGGEFETLVIDGPIFQKRIEIKNANPVWEYNSGFYVIEKAELKEK